MPELPCPPPGHLREFSYRHGYQQGAEALAFAMGVTTAEFRQSTWGRRITAWRDGDLFRQEEPPHWITPAELAELRRP